MPCQAKKMQKWPSFIRILFDILEDQTNIEGLQWSEGGEYIFMKDVSFFTNQTLPKYFKHSNLSSFIRQLNMYDFRKATGDSGISKYSHPHFRKGKQTQFRRIKRKIRKMSYDLEEVKLPQKRSPEELRQRMLKLSKRQERLKKQNDDLLEERQNLLQVREQQQKEYDILIKNNKHPEKNGQAPSQSQFKKNNFPSTNELSKIGLEAEHPFSFEAYIKLLFLHQNNP